MSDATSPAAVDRSYEDGFNVFTAWWAVFVLVLFQIISLIDRTVIAVLVPEIRADLGLSDFELSLIQGMAFALFYGVMGLFIGGLVDRFPRRLIMFGGVVIWSFAAASVGFAGNYAHLFLSRLMVGFGEGAISPAAQSLLSGIFLRHRLSTPMSCFVAAGIVGMSLSFALGGWLVDAFTHAPLGGPLKGFDPWRQVLIVTGLPGALLAFLAFTLKEPARPSTARQEASWRNFFDFIRQHGRLFGFLLGGYCLSAMATQGAMMWAPTYARRVLGVGAAEVGSAMALAIGVGGVIGTLSMGVIVDRLFSRGAKDAALRVFFICALVCPPITAAGFLIGDAGLMFAGLGLMLLTLGACFGPALAAVQMVAPPLMRGRFGALCVLVTNLGGFAFGPMLVGALTDYVYRDPDSVGLSIATAVIVLGPAAAAMVWFARKPFVARIAAAELASG